MALVFTSFLGELSDKASLLSKCSLPARKTCAFFLVLHSHFLLSGSFSIFPGYHLAPPSRCVIHFSSESEALITTQLDLCCAKAPKGHLMRLWGSGLSLSYHARATEISLTEHVKKDFFFFFPFQVREAFHGKRTLNL